jgi:hypothetical protein
MRWSVEQCRVMEAAAATGMQRWQSFGLCGVERQCAITALLLEQGQRGTLKPRLDGGNCGLVALRMCRAL